MSRWMFWVFAAGLICLAGCAQLTSPDRSGTSREEPAVETVDPQQLLTHFSTLPAAAVTLEAGFLEVRYEAGALFTAESVLPLAGGVEVLDPLANSLGDYQGLPWEVVVSAQTDQGGEYNQSLAEKRLDLMIRYLERSGLDLSHFSKAVDLTQESPVVVKLAVHNQDVSSSPGSKE